jgi:hypothetical protein
MLARRSVLLAFLIIGRYCKVRVDGVCFCRQVPHSQRLNSLANTLPLFCQHILCLQQELLHPVAYPLFQTYTSYTIVHFSLEVYIITPDTDASPRPHSCQTLIPLPGCLLSTQDG